MSTTVTQAANPGGNVLTTTTNLTGGLELSESINIDPIKDRTVGGVAADWSADFGALIVASANANEACALDSSVLIGGKPAVKCTFSDTAGATTYIGRYTPTNPISFKNFVSLEIPFRVTCNESATNVATFANQFGIWLKAASGKQARLRVDSSGLQPGGWMVLRWTRSETSTVVSFSGGASDWSFLDTETITAIDFVYAATVAANTAPVWIGPLVVNAQSRGIVTLRMDRQYDSQYSIIKPLLDQYGIKTSLAVVHQSIGTGNSMTTAQITEMCRDGHEVIHHTYSSTKTNGYANATDWTSAAAISDDINAGWANMRTNGWLSGIGKIVEAYTGNYFASATTKARQLLLKTAFNAAGVEVMATISTGSKTNNSTRVYGITPGFVRSSLMITSTTTPTQVIAAITQAEQNGEWLIITIHEAVADSATPAGNQMRASDFATWLLYLGGRKAANGVEVLPLGNAYNAIYK